MRPFYLNLDGRRSAEYGSRLQAPGCAALIVFYNSGIISLSPFPPITSCCMADLDEKHSTPRPSFQPSSDEAFSVSQESCRAPLPAYSDNDSRTDPHIHLDGGLKANLTTLGAFTALFFTFGQINAFGTFQAWYSAHQLAGMRSSTISWIGSLQLWIFFFSVCHQKSLRYSPHDIIYAGLSHRSPF